MADLAATNLAWTVLNKGIAGKKRRVFGKLVFGDGSSTWPSGHLAVTVAQLGLIRQADMVVFQANNGYRLEYNKANGKVELYFSDLNGSVDGPDIAATGATPASATYYWEAIGL